MNETRGTLIQDCLNDFRGRTAIALYRHGHSIDGLTSPAHDELEKRIWAQSAEVRNRLGYLKVGNFDGLMHDAKNFDGLE